VLSIIIPFLLNIIILHLIILNIVILNIFILNITVRNIITLIITLIIIIIIIITIILHDPPTPPHCLGSLTGVFGYLQRSPKKISSSGPPRQQPVSTAQSCALQATQLFGTYCAVGGKGTACHTSMSEGSIAGYLATATCIDGQAKQNEGALKKMARQYQLGCVFF